MFYFIKIKIYLYFLLFNYFISSNYPFLFKCLEDDLKLDDICAIEGTSTTEDEETLTQVTTKYLYIKETCSSDEKCKKMGDSHLYQCFPKIEKLEIGDKCSVNEECYTGLCTMDICQGIDFEGDCSDYPNACKPGLFCTDINVDGTRICAEYSYLHEKCGNGDWGYYKKCFPGLGCQLREDGSGTYVCKKWGTVSESNEVDDEKLCVSGMAMLDDYDNKIKCISIEEDGECDEEIHKCSPLISGLGANPNVGEEITLDCVGGLTNMYTCPFGAGKTLVFRKYIDKYNELYDVNELKKSQYFIEGYFNDYELTELFIKYKNYEYLRAYELIDFEGNVNGLYSCEYDFVWTFIDSDYIKPNFFIIIIFIFLVFTYFD